MKRYQSTLLGVSLTALALMIIAVGCSSSNPVAPQTTGVKYENPQYSERIEWGDRDNPATTNAQREDVRVDVAAKFTPAIIMVDEDSPITTGAIRFDNLRIE
jgi:hypothetical protein